MSIAKKIVMQNVIGLALLALGIAIGVVANRYWQQPLTNHVMPEKKVVNKTAEEPAVLYWYDPMYPQQRFDKPGKSPFMDMQLVPRYAAKNSATSDSSTTLKIDPRITQQLGLREAQVERIALTSEIITSGIVGFNQRAVAIEQARSAGFVKKVWPLVDGDVIRANQPLVELVIPEWTAAAQEFIALRDLSDTDLQAAARTRLQLLGMSESVINSLQKTTQASSSFVLSSSRSGVLQSFDLRNGMSIATGQTLARINGIDSVWLDVAVPEALANNLAVGTQAEVRLSAFPAQVFNAKVTAILPTLAEASRSIRVRVELPNINHQLRPGMSAQVQLKNNSSRSALTIPTEAIIRTGKRALVMVVEEQGHFTAVEVTLGREINNRTVIEAGLNEGQRVVASGQFLLDSEASLSGITARQLPSSADETMPKTGAKP